MHKAAPVAGLSPGAALVVSAKGTPSKPATSVMWRTQEQDIGNMVKNTQLSPGQQNGWMTRVGLKRSQGTKLACVCVCV